MPFGKPKIRKHIQARLKHQRCASHESILDSVCSIFSSFNVRAGMFDSFRVNTRYERRFKRNGGSGNFVVWRLKPARTFCHWIFARPIFGFMRRHFDVYRCGYGNFGVSGRCAGNIIINCGLFNRIRFGSRDGFDSIYGQPLFRTVFVWRNLWIHVYYFPARRRSRTFFDRMWL